MTDTTTDRRTAGTATPGRLTGNVASLGLLQLATYAFPLAALHLLGRALGVDGYGRVSFVMAVAAYATLVVDYGFNLSATAELSQVRDDLDERRRVFWQTTIAKLWLFAGASVVLVALALAVPRLNEVRGLILIALLAPLGAAITPVWYYQALERMGRFAAVNSAVRLAAIPLIWLVVDSTGDTAAAVAIMAGVIGMAGLANFAMAIGTEDLGRPHVRGNDVRATLARGWSLFLSQAGVSLYTTASLIVVGFVSGDAEVGILAAAVTITRAAHGVGVPVAQACFPRAANLLGTDRERGFVFVRRLAWFQGGLTLVVALAMVVAAPTVAGIVFDEAAGDVADVIRLLAPTVFLVGLSNVFGVQTLLPLGHRRAFATVLLTAGAVNLALLFPLATRWGAMGAAAAAVVSEAVVTIALAVVVARRSPAALPSWSPNHVPA